MGFLLLLIYFRFRDGKTCRYCRYICAIFLWLCYFFWLYTPKLAKSTVLRALCQKHFAISTVLKATCQITMPKITVLLVLMCYMHCVVSTVLLALCYKHSAISTVLLSLC